MPVIQTNSITTLARYGRRPDIQKAPNYGSAGAAFSSAARVYDTQIGIERANLRDELGRIEDKHKRRQAALETVRRTATQAIDVYGFLKKAELRREELAAQDAANNLMKHMADKAYSRVDENGNKVVGSLDAEYTFNAEVREGGEASSPSLATRKLYADWMVRDEFNNLSPKAKEIFEKQYRDKILDPFFRKADANTLQKYEQYKKNVQDGQIQLAKDALEKACTFGSLQDGTYKTSLNNFLALTLDEQFVRNGLADRNSDWTLSFRKDNESGHSFEEMYNAERNSLSKEWNALVLGKVFQEAVNENVNDKYSQIRTAINSVLENDSLILPENQKHAFREAFKKIDAARSSRITKDYEVVKANAEAIYYDFALGRVKDTDLKTALFKAVKLYKDSKLPGEKEKEEGIRSISEMFFASDIADALEISNKLILSGADEKRLTGLKENDVVAQAVARNLKENKKAASQRDLPNLKTLKGDALCEYLLGDDSAALTLSEKISVVMKNLNSSYGRGLVSKGQYNGAVAFLKDWDFILRHEKKDGLALTESKHDAKEADSALDTLFGVDINPASYFQTDENGLIMYDKEGSPMMIQNARNVKTHLLGSASNGGNLSDNLQYGSSRLFNKGITITAEAYTTIYTAARKYLTMKKIAPDKYNKSVVDYLKETCAAEITTISDEVLKRTFREQEYIFDNFGYLQQQ